MPQRMQCGRAQVDERVSRYALQFSAGICASAAVVGYTNFVFFSHSVEHVKVRVLPRPPTTRMPGWNSMPTAGLLLSQGGMHLDCCLQGVPKRRSKALSPAVKSPGAGHSRVSA